MTHKKAMIHEVTGNHFSYVAATFFLRPQSFKYVGKGKWLCGCRKDAMTLKSAMAHDPWCQSAVTYDAQGRVAASCDRKESVDKLSSQWADLSARNVASWHEEPEAAEWDSEAGSLHGLLGDRSKADGNTTSVHREGTVFEYNDGDDDDNDNDNGDDDGAVIVENFRRCHDVDASRKDRMRSFYEMTTDQQIQKIQEVIRDLRGQ
ncbi:hypothetical protein EDB84DRAFT_657629 [Lactarius hengduanensis]|nr:hypothetical protein EDB84DRAFT_657629 [Lactarius hengduanensis]